MWNLTAKFDPLTGVRIAARIDAMVQALFAQTVPDECPTDPIEKQRYLTARALAQLLLDNALADTNSAPRPAKPEFVVVIDADAPGHVGPVAEFTSPSRSPDAASPTTAANSTTSAGGATAEPPTSTISYRSAASTTPTSTTTTGSSNSNPTENSPSHSPTAPSTPPDHPTDKPPPDYPRSGTRSRSPA